MFLVLCRLSCNRWVTFSCFPGVCHTNTLHGILSIVYFLNQPYERKIISSEAEMTLISPQKGIWKPRKFKPATSGVMPSTLLS